MTWLRSCAAAWFLWAAANYAFAGEAALGRFEFSQPHMGTWFKIIVYAPDAAAASRASDAAFQRIAGLDDTMTDYNPRSELMSLCQQAGGPPVPLSEDLFQVLAASEALSERTHGAFDVTIGPLVRLWRRARRQHELPPPDELAHARELVGHGKLRLDPRARTAQLLQKGMLLDLGGIAKGYAADQALAVLSKYGITSALVTAGGDIAVSAPPPGQQAWRIGIAPLESPEKPPTRFLLLQHAAVSTSGEAEQHVEIAGKRYSHIVDPRTGMALVGQSSVTIVASNATTSDALATAVSVLGPDRGLELVRSTPGTAAFIMQTTDQGLRTFQLNLAPYIAPAE